MSDHIVDLNKFKEMLEIETEPWITDDFIPLYHAAGLIREHVGDIYNKEFKIVRTSY